MALNTAETLAAEMYCRLGTLARGRPGMVQLIIGDNEIPGTYRQDFVEVDFDHGHPTIATVEHPGLAAVETINARGAE
jgi:hypothetical protein